MKLRPVLLVALMLVPLALASGQVPHTLSYQGLLTNSAGVPLEGTFALTFRLYTTPAGGAALWTEAHPGVAVQKGTFNVTLGSITPLSAVSFGQQLYVGVTEGATQEFAPRWAFNSVPYAFRADTAMYIQSGGGTFLPLSGGTMTGAITSAGDPPITMGKGNFGTSNTNSGIGAFVAGQHNTASGDYSTIGGGAFHTASGWGSTVAGGGFSDPTPGLWLGNSATGYDATVGGGEWNDAVGIGATIAGGIWNFADSLGTVGGGAQNAASIGLTTVGGGFFNKASGHYSVIAGGCFNMTRGAYAVVSGGGGASLADSNCARGDYASVGGGSRNTASGISSTIAGGSSNIAGGGGSVVAGGAANTASAAYATVGGGGPGVDWPGNTASGEYSTVAGGAANTASASNAALGGGYWNTSAGDGSVVAGGLSNTANGGASSIGGGESGFAVGLCSTVPGGSNNNATGDYSFAAGRHARAIHHGAFVWADQTNADFSSSADNQFNIRASGGTRIYSNSALTTGVRLNAGGGSWSSVSDSSLKRNARVVDAAKILERLSRLPIKQWSYLSQDPSIEHVGPMAQDFYALFGLGDDNKTISTTDPSGIALAAAQELYRQVQQLQDRNQTLTTQNAELASRLARLEALVGTLVHADQAHGKLLGQVQK